MLYVDILFSINFFMNVCVLYISTVLLRHKVAIKTILAMSFLWALICSVFAVFFIKNTIINIFLAGTMLLISAKVIFKPPNLKILFNRCLVILFTSFFMAGIFVWVCGYSNLLFFIHNDFVLTGSIFLISFLLVMTIFGIWHKKIRLMTFEENKYVLCLLEYNNKNLEINLFIDSGCMLTKTADGRCIFLIETYEILTFFEDEFSCEVLSCEGGDFISVSKAYGKEKDFEMIEISTASGKTILPGLKCKATFKMTDFQKQEEVLAVMYNGEFFTDNDCKGIIGADMLKIIMEVDNL